MIMENYLIFILLLKLHAYSSLFYICIIIITILISISWGRF